MSLDPEAPSPGSQPQPESQSESSGFEIYEGLLAEAILAGGESPTLRRWVDTALERLEGVREGGCSPREARASERIEEAYRAAAELLQRSLPPKEDS